MAPARTKPAIRDPDPGRGAARTTGSSRRNGRHASTISGGSATAQAKARSVSANCIHTATSTTRTTAAAPDTTP